MNTITAVLEAQRQNELEVIKATTVTLRVNQYTLGLQARLSGKPLRTTESLDWQEGWHDAHRDMAQN